MSPDDLVIFETDRDGLIYSALFNTETGEMLTSGPTDVVLDRAFDILGIRWVETDFGNVFSESGHPYESYAEVMGNVLQAAKEQFAEALGVDSTQVMIKEPIDDPLMTFDEVDTLPDRRDHWNLDAHIKQLVEDTLEERYPSLNISVNAEGPLETDPQEGELFPLDPDGILDSTQQEYAKESVISDTATISSDPYSCNVLHSIAGDCTVYTHDEFIALLESFSAPKGVISWVGRNLDFKDFIRDSLHHHDPFTIGMALADDWSISYGEPSGGKTITYPATRGLQRITFDETTANNFLEALDASMIFPKAPSYRPNRYDDSRSEDTVLDDGTVIRPYPVEDAVIPPLDLPEAPVNTGLGAEYFKDVPSGTDVGLGAEYLKTVTAPREWTAEEQDRIAGLLGMVEKPTDDVGGKPAGLSENRQTADSSDELTVPKAFESNVAAAIAANKRQREAWVKEMAEASERLAESHRKLAGIPPTQVGQVPVRTISDDLVAFYNPGQPATGSEPSKIDEDWTPLTGDRDIRVKAGPEFAEFVMDGVNWTRVAFDLWKIIDNIDTFSDVAKIDDVVYRTLVEAEQRKRWDTLPKRWVEMLHEQYFQQKDDPLKEDEDE